ncbi:MAG: LPD38 domain-containing protein, partial [Planctomycetota bacterium]
EMGKEPIPDVTKKAETDQTEDEDFNPRDNYLISRTNNNIYVVYRRSNHDVVGFADNDEQLDEIIANDQQHYGRHEREQREQQIEAERFADLTQLEPIGSAIEASGIITESMVGNLIHVITGHTTHGFAHTFKPPLLAGARQSYEDITYKIWNKELKKYGVQIKETFVNTRDQRKAMEEEGGEAIVIESREDKIKAEHGTLEIQELQGDMHGWVVVSEKKGLVFNDVWENKRYAEERLARYIEENFGTEGEGVRVQYFEINDKMREEFSKPTAPFMMGRRNEPEALKDMRGKIGVPKGRRMQDLRDRIKVFRQGFVATAQQGIFDEFYGLKRALREAGVTDESYIDARLSTSLDSMMKGVLFYGHPVWKEGIVQSEGRGLMEILQPILSNHEDWGIFMAARRGRELMLEGYDKLSDEDKALIDRAAEKFGGNIIDMISFSEMQDPELGERQGDTMSKSARRRVFELERDIEQLQEETKKGIYRDKEGRRITIEQVRESAASLREKWAGINRRRKKPSKAFMNRVRSHLKFYEDQLNPDAAIERLQKQYNEFMTRYKPHKKKKHKPWAKRDRVKEAEGAIKRLKEAGREHLFTAGNIRAGLQLGETNPVFQRVADEYAEFNKKMLDFAEESGLINPDDRDTWESANYVPFYRVDDERLIGSSFSPRSGIANQKAPIRRLRGGKQNVGDVVGNIMVNTAKLLDASVKNNAALNAIDALRGTGVVQKKPLAFEPVLIEMGQLKKILIDRGVIVPDDEEDMKLSDIDPKALEGFQKMFAIGAPKGEGIMSVMRNGKREYYYTDDALLFRSMTAINKKQFGEWIQMFTGPKRLLTTLITVDPAFMVANFLRDTGSAFVIGRDHWGNIPFVSALKGFNQALMNDEAIRTMTSAGAAFENGYITGGDPRRVKRLIKQYIKDPKFYDTIIDTPAKAARAWLTLGAAVENSNRVAMYNAAIAAGKSKKRAVFEAKDLMDFSMGGDWTVIRFLIQTVPFMNARNQGNYRLGKAMVENPVAFAVKGMLVGLAGFALWAAFKDDERYKDLEMWDKHAYFHFWIGDMHFRIPKPFEVGPIFNTPVQMWGNYLNSKENDAGKYLLREYGHMVGQTFALLPFPQTFAPVLESGINYSFFKQGPLVGYYEQKRLPPDQYRYRTSPTLIELAKRMPKELDTVSNRIRSPLHLQNLYLGYTGTIGRYLLQGADMLVRRSLEYPLPPAPEAPDWIVAGRFYRGEGPARRTKYEDEVYRMLSKTTEIQGSLAFHERYGNAEEYEKTLTDPDYQPYIRAADSLESIRENITEVNRAIQMIYLDTEMDRDKKTEEINLLEETRNNLFREAYKLRPGGEYNPVDSPPATDEQALLMIEEWGVDNSTAFMRRIQEQTPDTYELLEMISNDMNSRQLKMLAKAGN